MIEKIFNLDKISKKIAGDIVTEANKSLAAHAQKNLEELNQIKEVLAHLYDKVSNMEAKIQNTQLKTNNDYGHLTYKISELQSKIKDS
ncbi:MAG: hypothetical protein N4A33_13580 [Bacteriovoracaceae bacterium]|jgi:hypothetical protein|nr:hypothetical protein [Bacteriovoracaceae bacterium]